MLFINNVRMLKLRSVRWAGHVARKDDMKNTYKFSVRRYNATLSATSAAVWQYEVLSVVYVTLSFVEVKFA